MSGAQKGAEMLRHPCILRNPQQGEKNQKRLPHPCLLGGPKEGRNAMSRLHSRESKSEAVASLLPSRGPKKGQKCYVTPAFSGIKIRSGCLTPAFSGAQERAEMLRHPCILGGPRRQASVSKSDVAQRDVARRGPKRGWKCSFTPAFLGTPNKREQNQKWLPHPCLLGGPKEGGSAMSPLHSRGSPTHIVPSCATWLTPPPGVLFPPRCM